ncbi:hypothetical protein SDC9_117845 [bioreactor metagenome]|uniref:Uncharacterized protein n=1 Tax=bioreactor metagenome TaxID=1076179 RepID=A0A645C8L2_9ZZZZ
MSKPYGLQYLAVREAIPACGGVVAADTAIITIFFANIGEFDQSAQINRVADVLLLHLRSVTEQGFLFIAGSVEQLNKLRLGKFRFMEYGLHGCLIHDC